MLTQRIGSCDSIKALQPQTATFELEEQKQQTGSRGSTEALQPQTPNLVLEEQMLTQRAIEALQPQTPTLILEEQMLTQQTGSRDSVKAFSLKLPPSYWKNEC